MSDSADLYAGTRRPRIPRSYPRLRMVAAYILRRYYSTDTPVGRVFRAARLMTAREMREHEERVGRAAADLEWDRHCEEWPSDE